MTQHGIQRCEHGKVNRCRLCGVERVRGVLTDGAGAHVGWRVAWRPTRARIGTPSRALYNPNQPRDHGMFASAGGSGTGGHDDSKNEREPSGGHGTDKADAGGDKAPPPGQPPGASASARAGTQQAEAHGQGSSP